MVLSNLLQTRRDKIIAASFIALIVLIPTSSALIAQRLKAGNPSVNYDRTVTNENPKEVPKTVPGQNTTTADIPNSTAEENAVNQLIANENTAQISFGPSLNFQLVLQGRPKANQADKVFLGIAQGAPQLNPQYILSFMVDLAADGIYKNLGVAGLDTGTQYTAYFKGSSQIATASSFTLKPAFNDLGVSNLLSGYLNEDNIVNSADYSICANAMGMTVTSPNWNGNIDINKDGVINVFDLGFIVNNFNQVGASGVWQSTPAISTPSGTPNGGNSSLGSIGVDINSIMLKTPPPAGGTRPTPAPNYQLPTASSSLNTTEPLIVPSESGQWIFVPKN